MELDKAWVSNYIFLYVAGVITYSFPNLSWNMAENSCPRWVNILIEISMKFIAKGPIDNKLASV